jgi:hypothetical protein
MALVFAVSALNINAQVTTLHNPDTKVSLTPEQIKAFGQTSSHHSMNPIIIDFEGLGNLDDILQFYNGGTSKAGFSGQNFGVSFNQGTLAIIDSQHGGSGNFTTKSAQNTVMFFLSGLAVTINVADGFSSEFSFQCTASATGSVAIYDGPDGTGNLLASIPFQSLVMGPGAGGKNNFDIWQLCKFPFKGNAKSVVITAKANMCAFDDMKFGDGGSDGPAKGFASASAEKSKSFGSVLTTPASTTEKGKLFLMGASRFGLSMGSEKSKSNGSVSEGSQTTYYDLDFLPKAGYYFINNLVGGLYIDLEVYNNKPKSSSGYGYSKGTTFIVGPFARYYVPVWDNVLPYVEGQVGFGIDNSRTKSSSSSDWVKTNENVFTYRVGAGVTYFVNNVVGVDGFMGYLHDSYKFKDSNDGSEGDSSSDSKSIYSEFSLQLGVVIVLDVCNH